MNREYRDNFVRRVNAARQGRTNLISHASFDAFDAEAKAKRKSGDISALDYVNCRAFIGSAVNGPRPEPRHSEF